MAIQYKDWTGAASISKKFSIHWETFLYKWVLLAQPVLGKQLISLCGSLCSWEHCCSAIPPHLILGLVPSEPDPRPAAAEWIPCRALVMGLIPDLMDHLQDKRISVSRTIQPCFVPILTARRALVALGFCEAPAERRWSSNSSFTGLVLGYPRRERECPLPWLLSHRQPGFMLGAFTFVSSRQLVAAGQEDPGVPELPGMQGPAAASRGTPRHASHPAQHKWDLVRPLQDAHASLCPKNQTWASH